MQMRTGRGLCPWTCDAYRDIRLDEVITAEINTKGGVLAYRFSHSVQVLVLREVGHGLLVINVPRTFRRQMGQRDPQMITDRVFQRWAKTFRGIGKHDIGFHPQCLKDMPREQL
ncbi:hypothetical protein GCM10014715_69420 [Streptomyces spiralis]|uniref:Uncharacterized protein n=1 Tax=Streptomyces spiralis TaxID=66376 RepID=A0A919AFS5_9ACTN|nr:hypothetical protein GCM10014715_69420 [Streptomyces spiralis]